METSLMNDTERNAPTLHAAPAALLPINAVERETGVSKELLRMWERRYHFPAPLRDAQGDRIYPLDQVNKLRLLRRLIEFGFRPGKIIEMPMEDLEKLLSLQNRGTVVLSSELQTELLDVLKSRNVHRTREYLSHQLVRMGLEAFILEFLQHTNSIVGDAWMRGTIEVYEEHLYTEQVQTLIRQAISNLREPENASPHIMITTPPDEQHSLGMLMVEAMLRLEKIDAVSFGSQMPIADIVQAVQKHKMDVVALSFSASFPTTRAMDFLEDLRFRLPMSVGIWAGGSSLKTSRRRVDGVHAMSELAALKDCVSTWREQRGNQH